MCVCVHVCRGGESVGCVQRSARWEQSGSEGFVGYSRTRGSM